QAGLELARSLWGGFRVHGVTATRAYDVPARTAAIANEAAATLGLEVRVRPEDVVNFDDFVGPGYGRPSAEAKEAVQLFGRTEGLVLDPVYTGKCAAALIAHARNGRLTRGDTAVFVHTGGAPAIFTWSHLWTDAGAAALGERACASPGNDNPTGP